MSSWEQYLHEMSMLQIVYNTIYRRRNFKRAFVYFSGSWKTPPEVSRLIDALRVWFFILQGLCEKMFFTSLISALSAGTDLRGIAMMYFILSLGGDKKCTSLSAKVASWHSFYLFIHGDVIKWKHFRAPGPFVRGNSLVTGEFPKIGQWRGALMFSLIFVWTKGSVSNRDAGDWDAIELLMTSL